jgi:hypothetical protein
MKKLKKTNLMAIVKKTGITAATGVVTEIAVKAISATNEDYVNFGLLGLGVILPEVVKGNDMLDTASSAVVAIAAYKLSEKYDLAGKLGVTKSTTVTGLEDFKAIGNSGWTPGKTYQAQKVNSDTKKNDVIVNASSVR